MRNIPLFIITILVFTTISKGQEQFTISGKATNFAGQPLDSVTVYLKNNSFKNVYETLTDKNGNYSMKVNKGEYYCLYAIKLSEYRVNRLEYWAWNVPVYEDMVINPQYDKMEVYGVNVFEPQVGPYETYMIYFRPMSLAKGLKMMADQKVDKKDFKKADRTEDLIEHENKLMNISPDSLSKDELLIEINGTKAEIVGISKIKEYTRGFFMYGFVVQVIKPKDNENLKQEYDKVSITLHSRETDEIGKSDSFVKRKR
jgi:hypothetical protein